MTAILLLLLLIVHLRRCLRVGPESHCLHCLLVVTKSYWCFWEDKVPPRLFSLPNPALFAVAPTYTHSTAQFSCTQTLFIHFTGWRDGLSCQWWKENTKAKTGWWWCNTWREKVESTWGGGGRSKAEAGTPPHSFTGNSQCIIPAEDGSKTIPRRLAAFWLTVPLQIKNVVRKLLHKFPFSFTTSYRADLCLSVFSKRNWHHVEVLRGKQILIFFRSSSEGTGGKILPATEKNRVKVSSLFIYLCQRRTKIYFLFLSISRAHSVVSVFPRGQLEGLTLSSCHMWDMHARLDRHTADVIW